MTHNDIIEVILSLV